MQSGRAKTKDWLLETETTSARAPEALMGWTSSADTLNQVKMHFETKEEAVFYAEKHGMEYTVTEPEERRVRPRSYMDNFKYPSPVSGGPRKTGQKTS